MIPVLMHKSGTFDCDLQDAIKFKVAGFPDSEPLEGETFDLPYYIVGDDAFALRPYLMKPYSHTKLTKEHNFQLQTVSCQNNCGECIWNLDPAFPVLSWCDETRAKYSDLHCACMLHPTQHPEGQRQGRTTGG